MGIVIWFGLDLLLDTGGINDDGGFPVDRALVFTDAAACALLLLDDGTLLIIPNNGLIGALLIADEADFIRIPGDAPGLVNVGHPHLDKALLFDSERPNRLGRTNSSAEITELLAISDPGNKPRRVETCKARL